MRLFKLIFEFGKYVIVGGIAFVVDFSTLAFFRDFLKFDLYVSTGLGFITGLIVNYFLGLKLVFTENGANIKDFSAITVIGIIGLLLTELGMYAGVEKLGLHHLFTKIIIAAVVLAWNYGARKFLVYRSCSAT